MKPLRPGMGGQWVVMLRFRPHKRGKAPDAIERLGVGKNMVRSIRFWCQAFKIIEADRTGSVKPTPFGDMLLGQKGWDPYLEDLAFPYGFYIGCYLFLN